MSHEPGAEAHVDAGDGGEGDGHFAGALSETGTVTVARGYWVGRQAALAAQLVQVANGELQHIGLLELGHAGFAVLLGQGTGHQVLELVQATVDPGTALSLQQGFRDLE